VIAAGDIVPAKKPAPDISVCAAGNGPVGGDCIAFEDSHHGFFSCIWCRFEDSYYC